MSRSGDSSTGSLCLVHSTRSMTTSRQSLRPEFLYRNGSRFHPHSKEEVPYPFSIDREMLELFPLDRQIILRVQGQLNYVDFKDKPPKRCLDIGCGLGDWVIDMAKVWKESTFVGLDVVDVQLDLNYVEPSVAKRIQWVHSNLLRSLPFEDNTFDYVHISAMALSVPEDKWPFVYGELSRILSPGGCIEQIEEDAIFPVLPKWFTKPLHEAGRHAPRRFSGLDWPSDDLPHDHTLLERLFYSVFENRFIHPKPSSILPGYFSAFFQHVVSPPILIFPMPPLAPLPPSSHELHSLPPTEFSESSTTLDSHHSSPTLLTPTAPGDSHDRLQLVGSSRYPLHLRPITEESYCCPGVTSQGSGSGSGSTSDISVHTSTSSEVSHGPMHPVYAEKGETVEIGGEEAYSLYNMDKFDEIDDHTLFVHLYHSTGLVWAAKEAMWDELKVLVDRSDDTLVRYGWKPHDYIESESRKKFETFWNRYRTDMHERMAMWHVMMHYGWSYPKQSPMTQAEIMEQDQLRHAILEARMLAKEEDQVPSRLIRLLVGVNGK